MNIEAKKIVVLMGGPSAEREVSLHTGEAIVQALQEKGYNVEGVEFDPPRLAAQLAAVGADVVFNAIHGKFGEDGCLQGALEMMGMPYTGSGLLASAMAMNKVASKQIFQAAGVPTPRSKTYRHADASRLAGEIAREFSFPLVVKPAAQGSSLGVSVVESAEALETALRESAVYDDTILVEAFVDGRELTVAVLDGQALPVIEICPHSGRYDYTSKYTKGASDYIVPAALDAATTKRVQKAALAAYAALGCAGVARADVMLDKDGAPYVLEVNTVPGLTATSLVPKAAAAAGISFPDLCERQLLLALQKGSAVDSVEKDRV